MRHLCRAFRFAVLAPLFLSLGGCFSLFSGSGDSIPAAQRQLPASTQALLAIHGMTEDSPIFIRIFKEESELEVWKLKEGRFQHFRTYSICRWSGDLGPKTVVGDKQAPEGFYTVSAGQMNPNSLYHLAFNIGFPNAHDRANGYTGSALMVHGDCKSVGCYAMTDAYIEEIYIMARNAFAAGQTRFHVQAFPFRMTEANLQRHKDSQWYGFWTRLKEGYDAFEATGKPPVVKICSKQYLVNVAFKGAGEPAGDDQCPQYTKIDPSQLHGVDGVPPTLYASYSKPGAPAAGEKPVAVAAYSPRPEAQTPATAMASVEPAISASPVLLNAGGKAATAAPVKTAQKQPVKSEAPVMMAAASPAPPSRYDAAAPASPVVLTEIKTPDAPSKDVDPNAMEKPNRSGKGGKLAAAPGSDEPASPTAGSSVSMGFAPR